MADPYRETVVQQVHASFVPYLRDTILPDRAKHRNDTYVDFFPPTLFFQCVLTSICRLYNDGYVGVSHRAACNMMIVDFWDVIIEVIEIIERERVLVLIAEF